MIQLTDELALMTDDYNYIVGKPQHYKDGRTFIRRGKYYSTIAQAVRGAVRLTMRAGVADGSITSLRDFIERQEELEKRLAALVAPLE